MAKIFLAIDMMGGDKDAATLMNGVAIAAAREADIRFLLYGDEKLLTSLHNNLPALSGKCEIIHCEVSVAMNAKPSVALRTGRKTSSMWRTIEAVREARADAAISAGNTGALMAMAKFCLRCMDGIERPTIAAIWPTIKGQSIVVDVGASVGTEPGQLVDQAILGGALARILFRVDRPKIGLLNIGVEEVKGLEVIRLAGQHLRQTELDTIEYAGFVEGHDIGKGTVDVVVTEGFAGNIALKSAEGTAKQITQFLRSELSQGWQNKLGYLLARDAFSNLRNKLDPRKFNGGIFLGLNGLVIKSHGDADPEGFANAILLAGKMTANGLIKRISVDLQKADHGRIHDNQARTDMAARR